MNLTNFLSSISPVLLTGHANEISGPVVKAELMGAALGDYVEIETRKNIRQKTSEKLLAQVVGFSKKTAILSPLGLTKHVLPGARLKVCAEAPAIFLGEHLLGCVVDNLGRICHRFFADKTPSETGGLSSSRQCSLASQYRASDQAPPDALSRVPISQAFVTGIRSIDAFITIGRGQRLGVFAEPGVGKSSLISSVACAGSADVNVIALVGERGREVGDLIQRHFDDETKRRTVIVVATSDEPPLCRVQAAYTATTIAEYFRDAGLNVLLQLDSLTRLCRALREVGLAAGEVPVRRGYPPSVFSALPTLIERAGNSATGSITALYTVLMSSDLDEDPMVEEVKGLTDGHIVLKRALAERGHFPAVDVTSSVSRLAQAVTTAHQRAACQYARRMISRLENEKDLISLGGKADEELSEALRIESALKRFLIQAEHEKANNLEQTFSQLMAVVSQ